jgi:C-terminal processing protease CtpA/Prc
MSQETTRRSLARWRLARNVVLGTIAAFGTVAASTTLMLMNSGDDAVVTSRVYTYSGIGIGLDRVGHHVLVGHVFADGPAHGKLFRGAYLLSVNGQTYHDMRDWVSAIRGAPGTEVELEVGYRCGGVQVVTLERDIIQINY